jgi:hypothetical protein
MAGTIGRVASRLAMVHNETQAALASVNFDFILIKLDVPQEYSGLGLLISQKRKTDAEDRRLHQIARKLGALFDAVVPRAPTLFKAYGI